MENAEEVTRIIRDLFRIREELVPLLSAAFEKYKTIGIPPFRALVMDYPEDIETHAIEDQYMMGDKYMVAPLTAISDVRRFYIPNGTWMLYSSGEEFNHGWHEREFGLEELPLFEKVTNLLHGGKVI